MVNTAAAVTLTAARRETPSLPQYQAKRWPADSMRSDIARSDILVSPPVVVVVQDATNIAKNKSVTILLMLLALVVGSCDFFSRRRAFRRRYWLLVELSGLELL